MPRQSGVLWPISSHVETQDKKVAVPSGTSILNEGSGRTKTSARGDKNVRLQSGCQFNIATYNARSIRNERRLMELEYELDKI